MRIINKIRPDHQRLDSPHDLPDTATSPHDITSSSPFTLPRRTFLKATALGAASTSITSCGILTEEPATTPNIVFIMADDLGIGDIGAYGQQLIQTPIIDQMAAEGLRFTTAYSGHYVCRPARCSLMTGYHTGHALIRSNSMAWPLRGKDVSVAEMLKEVGYATAIFGKWALSGPRERYGADSSGTPLRKGFDQFVGYLDQDEAENYTPRWLWHAEEELEMPKNTYSPEYLIDLATKFIKQQRASTPFFLYLPLTLPHRGHGFDLDTNYPVPSIERYSHTDWPDWAKGYASMVSLIDDYVGQVLDTLKQQGIDEHTIVFLTSDNGATSRSDTFFDSNLEFKGEKKTLNEGGLRIPMIVRWPNHIEPGQVSNQKWAFWDFMATVADLAGATPPEDTDGLSITPTLLGDQQPEHEYFYWEVVEAPPEDAEMYLRSQAVRKDSWKLINDHVEDEITLYDLANDPGEAHDLAQTEPALVDELLELMDQAHEPWVEMEQYRL